MGNNPLSPSYQRLSQTETTEILQVFERKNRPEQPPPTEAKASSTEAKASYHTLKKLLWTKKFERLRHEIIHDLKGFCQRIANDRSVAWLDAVPFFRYLVDVEERVGFFHMAFCYTHGCGVQANLAQAYNYAHQYGLEAFLVETVQAPITRAALIKYCRLHHPNEIDYEPYVPLTKEEYHQLSTPEERLAFLERALAGVNSVETLTNRYWCLVVLLRGDGVDPDYERIRKIITVADSVRQFCDYLSQNVSANRGTSAKNALPTWEECFPFFQHLCNCDHYLGDLCLARCYLFGCGVPENLDEAFHYAQRMGLDRFCAELPPDQWKDQKLMRFMWFCQWRVAAFNGVRYVNLPQVFGEQAKK